MLCTYSTVNISCNVLEYKYLCSCMEMGCSFMGNVISLFTSWKLLTVLFILFLQRATTCSQEFAVLYYLVSVVGGAEQRYDVTDSRIMNQEVITLPVPSSGLQQNEVYSVFVSACISVTCRHSDPPIPFSKFISL